MTDALHPLARDAQRLQALGRRREAIDCYQRLLAQQPDDADSWYNLAWLLRHEARPEQALEAYAQALQRGVSAPEEVHLNRAAILSDQLRRDAEAEAELEAALRIAPDYAAARLNLGNLLEERGEREAAIAQYEALLARPGAADTARGEALARLAHLRPPQRADDPRLDELAAFAARTALDPTTRATLWFALGRGCERLGDHDRAFEAFGAGNRLERLQGRPYHADQVERLFDAIIAGSAPPAPASGAVPDAPQPLFICGMLRSGSTLVERVLAAHPQVVAGGELEWFPRLAAGPLSPFPSAPTRLGDAEAASLARAYLAHLAQLFPQAHAARYVTDKRPDNFQFLGLVKRLFPHARVIHTTRDPRDTGWSIYTQHLNGANLPYASALEDIGHYYGQYRRLMAHWKALYPGDILDFDYDAFVREPRIWLARLLEFLGLDWHEDCLQFHRHAGTVKTASYWQVREPLHARASGRWRAYATRLEPLRRALRAAGVELDD